MMKSITKILFITFLCSTIYSQNGVINSYFSGKKLRESISYVNGVLDGTSYAFYENGNLKEEKTYSNGKLHGWTKNYYDTGLLKEEASVKNGVLDGQVRLYYNNGALMEVRTYDMGKLIKRVQLEFDSMYVAPLEAYVGNRQDELRKNRELFICKTETCPRPAGGIDAIQKNLVYPEYAKLYGLEGAVTILATVDIRGDVIKTEIVKGLGLGCDEAASEAVMKTKFLPGADNGVAVETEVIFKVEFKLDEKDKKLVVKPDEQLTLENSELRNIIEHIGEKKEDKSKTAPAENKNNLPSKVDQIVVKDNFSCELEKCPEPANGLSAILEHLVIPQRVKRLKISGEITVNVDVDEYGLVRDTKVVSGLGYGADVAAEVAILSTMFNPGMDSGKPVRAWVKVIVPIQPDQAEDN